MSRDFVKRRGHEVCSTVHIRLRCIRIANICGFATTVSGEAGATVWRRSDYDRERFNPGFSPRSLRYSAEVGLYLLAGRNKVAPRR
jgi:hypothetical protein